MIDQCATIERVSAGQVMARLEGELWSVRCADPLVVGDRIRVRAMDGLTLVVDKLED